MPARPLSIRSLRPLLILAGVVFIVMVLSLGRQVLIPIALAILLTFILTPLVTGLQRRGLGRTFAVILVVLVTFAVMGVIGWGVSRQVTGLLDDLTTNREYRANLRAKIQTLRELGGSGRWLERFREIGQWLTTGRDATRLEPADAAVMVTRVMPGPLGIPLDFTAMRELSAGLPLPVPRAPPAGGSASFFDGARAILEPAIEPLATAGLVVILVIFMLIKREDLRNRLIRVIGFGRLTMTTRALDDAGTRISRYLWVQLLVNASFGLAVGIGLFVLGIPHAPLWGFLFALLRYIPYLGPWIAAIFPIALSLVVFPGWSVPLYVLGLILVLELLTYNVLEPLLFGRSAGVSAVALLIAAAFWTWLWGPIGLILSTPLTTCLVVLGKYVKPLEFFDILLGDEPVLDARTRFYQRLLAHDEAEAADLVEDQLRSDPVEAVCEEILLPTLVLAQRDRQRGELTANDETLAFEVTRRVIGGLVAPANGQPQASGANAEHPGDALLVLGCPGHDLADELALRMLQVILDRDRVRLEIVSADMLSSEMLAEVDTRDLAVACIAAVPPGGVAQARYLCKRLRARFRDLKILIGRWGAHRPSERLRQRFHSAGADQVGFRLVETRNQLYQLCQLAVAGRRARTSTRTGQRAK